MNTSQRNIWKQAMREATAYKVRFARNDNVTIAYQPNGGLVKFAVTYRNPKDTENALYGRYLAYNRLSNGQHASIHVPAGKTATNMIYTFLRALESA